MEKNGFEVLSRVTEARRVALALTAAALFMGGICLVQKRRHTPQQHYDSWRILEEQDLADLKHKLAEQDSVLQIEKAI